MEYLASHVLINFFLSFQLFKILALSYKMRTVEVCILILAVQRFFFLFFLTNDR